MSELKKWLLILIGLIGILVIIFVSEGKRKKGKWEGLAENGYEAIGSLTNIYKGSRASYEVDGKIYSRSTRSHPRGMLDGEQYIVMYSKGDPNVSAIDFYSPVHDSSKYRLICIDSFVQINGSDKGLISFEYSVKGNVYTRYQYLKIDKGVSYPYKVWVNKDNPRIAYLEMSSCQK